MQEHKPLLSTHPHWLSLTLPSLMTELRCRHLPVVAEDGNELLGIVSIGDGVKRIVKTAETETARLSSTSVARTRAEEGREEGRRADESLDNWVGTELCACGAQRSEGNDAREKRERTRREY